MDLFGAAKAHRSTSRSPAAALPGRSSSTFAVPQRHAVLGGPLQGPWPQGAQVLTVGMGCFWGAERIFWGLTGVLNTAVGYQGGETPFPTYDEVCSGRTGHTEAVLVVYDPQVLATSNLLATFWQGHDPTQGLRQGNDRGPQYRSAIYWSNSEQEQLAADSRLGYQRALQQQGFGEITTEIRSAQDAGIFYFAEDYHQQYLHKVPNGYCGIGGTGVSCPH